MRVRRQRVFREFGSGATSENQYIERYHPQRPMSLESEFAVPMLVGLGAAVLFSPLAAIIVTRIVSDITWWTVLPIAFLTIAGGMFLLKHNAASATCWDVEHIPLVTQEPEPATATERAIVVHAPNNRSFNATQEPEPEPAIVEQPAVVDDALDDFRQFVRGCDVGSTGLRRWEPVIGRETYNTYRDRLLEAGFAEWKNPGNEKNGWKLAYSAGIICQALSVMSR